MKTRILSLFLAFMMLLGTVSIPVACAEEDAPEAASVTNYASSAADEDLTEFVDMRYGTGTSSECLIGPSRPNGSVHPGPDTFPTNNYTGYWPNKPIRGFSQLHIQSGEGRFGQFLISPQVGLSVALDSHDSAVSNENPTATEYSVTLSKYDIDVSLTPTENAVIYKFTYPVGTADGDEASILLDMIHHVPVYNESNGGVYNKTASDVDISIEQDENGNTILYGGAKYGAHGGSDRYYYFYAVIESDSLANKSIGVYKQGAVVDGATAIDTPTGTIADPNFKGTGAFLKFDLDDEAETSFKMKIAVSFKNVEKAKASLEAEIPAWDYDKVKNDNNAIWNDKLDVMEVSGLTDYQKKMFYTNLYDTFLQPRYRTGELAEYGDGMMLDDHVATWDTFRTLFPLLSITNPQIVTDQVESYLVRFADKEAGSADTVKAVKDIFTCYERTGTNQGGDNIDNVIAEAYVKGLIPDEMMDELYALVEFEATMMRTDRNANDQKNGSLTSTYKDLGWIPGDTNATMCCNTQLEYCYNDYCLAQIAKGEGDEELYEMLMERSASWLNIWNEDAIGDKFTGFIWPKNADGTWVEPNDNLKSATHRIGSWKPYFYEGTPYEYSFFVPHDIPGLINKIGGEAEFIERLQVGIDNGYIHIGNQPGYIQAFLFNYTSEPWHTTDYVGDLINKYTLSGTPGCEDSGASCAWYIFANIGFFPNAGQDIYWLTSPKYEQTKINLDNGKTFTVTANNLSDENKYIQSVTLNGETLYSTMIRHSDIVGGGELVFNMGNTPVDYSTTVLASGKTADGEYDWSLRNNGVLSISGDGDGVLNFDSTITEANFADIPWNAYKDTITSVNISEASGITGISDYVFADLPVCEKITVPTTLTDLGANGIFAGDTLLDTIGIQGRTVVNGSLQLYNTTALGNDIFKDCADGMTVTLVVGKCENFAPNKWFTGDTTVNFDIEGYTSAEAWVKAVNAGTSDTRADGYKFSIGTVETTAKGEDYIENDNWFKWTLDTETGILTFENPKSSWNELTFSSKFHAFNDWVVDWADEIEHIVIPAFSKICIRTNPFANLKNLKTVKTSTTRWMIPEGSRSIFSGCESLTTFGTASNYELGKIKLGGISFESLGSVSPAFFTNCKSITDVDFTGAKFWSSDGSSSAFAWGISSNMFSGCSSLTNVNIADASFIQSNAFKDCTALREITIPTSVGTIASNAFAGCSALEAVYVENTSYTDGFMTSTSFPDQDGLVINCQNKAVQDSINALGYTKTVAIYDRYATGSETVGNSYSWSLDKETGILTFTDDKPSSAWCELSFTSDATAFATWVADYKDDIKHIVIPYFDKLSIANGVSSPFASLKNLESVKIDATRWLLNSKSLFEGCTALTSLGNSTSFEEGKIKLSGYQIDNLGGGALSFAFTNCSSITSVDFTGLKARSDGGGATPQGIIIRSSCFEGCSSLREVIFGEAVTINSSAFKDCTALKSVTIPATLTTIGDSAFAGCTALTKVTLEADSVSAGFMTATSLPDKDGLVVYCNNSDVKAAFDALGYKLTKAVDVNAKAVGGIKMEGFSIRTEGYNGLRGIFSFDNSVIAENEANGFTLVEYGALLASESNKNAYGTELTFNGTSFVTANSKVIKKAVRSGSKFVGSILPSSTEDRTDFAVSVVRYANNYTTGICMLGYAIWQDDAGNYYYTYVDCENDAYDTTSIYDVTIGMYKNGVVNAEDDPDDVIWGVLEACAVTLTAGTHYRDGDRDLNGTAFASSIKFANMPLYEASGSGTATGGKYDSSHDLKGLTFTRKGDMSFTILPDGENYVVVFRGNGELPACSIYGQRAVSQINRLYNSYLSGASWTSNPTALLYDNAGAVIGYVDQAGRYIALGEDYDTNGNVVLDNAEAHRRQPTPTLLFDSTISKIKTVILDHGVTKISDSFFCDNGKSHIDTVIYASTVKTVDARAFMTHKTLNTVSPKGVTPTANLFDLTGFTKFGDDCFNKTAITGDHMVLLPKGVKINASFFAWGNEWANIPSIVAISTDRRTLISGLADLRGVKEIGSKAFLTKKISKVYFDDSITSLANDAFPTNSVMTVYTNAANVGVVSTFTAASGNRTYVGGTPFATAAGLEKDPTVN